MCFNCLNENMRIIKVNFCICIAHIISMILVILAKLFDNWENWLLCNHHISHTRVIDLEMNNRSRHNIIMENVFIHLHYSPCVNVSEENSVREPLNRGEKAKSFLLYAHIALFVCQFQQWKNCTTTQRALFVNNNKKRISLAYEKRAIGHESHIKTRGVRSVAVCTLIK